MDYIATLERWVAEHQPTVYRAAYLILRDPHGAQDVAQETFIRAYRAADRLRPGDDPKPWLYRIATNTALNALRSKRNEAAAMRKISHQPNGAEGPDVETRSVVAEAVDRLPDRLRMAVILRYYLDLSERDIASALGVRPGTVKSRLFEARTMLAGDTEMLSAAGKGGEAT